MEYLISAYRDLGDAANRNSDSDTKRKLEAGFHDIQLFGTDEQLQALSKTLSHHETYGDTSLDEILRLLRDDLRRELLLPKTDQEIKFYRFVGGYDYDKAANRVREGL